MIQTLPGAVTDLTLPQALGLGGIAAGIAAVGSLIALVLKERVFARSFETWKSRRVLEGIYRKYRDPLALSATELATRVKEICDGEGVDYVRSTVREAEPPQLQRNWASDPYYLRYKFDSTVYRLCSLFGWLELYRQEVVFLDTGKARHNQRLVQLVGHIREDIADGQLNGADDWSEWHDFLLFREEQRAIGELMIDEMGGQRLVLGYAEFLRRWRDATHPAAQWFEKAAFFIQDIGERDHDFRRYRMLLLFIDLIALVTALDRTKVGATYDHRAAEYKQKLPPWVGRPTDREKQQRIVEMVSATHEGVATN